MWFANKQNSSCIPGFNRTHQSLSRRIEGRAGRFSRLPWTVPRVLVKRLTARLKRRGGNYFRTKSLPISIICHRYPFVVLMLPSDSSGPRSGLVPCRVPRSNPRLTLVFKDGSLDFPKKINLEDQPFLFRLPCLDLLAKHCNQPKRQESQTEQCPWPLGPSKKWITYVAQGHPKLGCPRISVGTLLCPCPPKSKSRSTGSYSSIIDASRLVVSTMAQNVVNRTCGIAVSEQTTKEAKAGNNDALMG